MRDTLGFSVSIHLHIEIYYRRYTCTTYLLLHFTFYIDS